MQRLSMIQYVSNELIGTKGHPCLPNGHNGMSVDHSPSKVRKV